MDAMIRIAESGYLPDGLVRVGIRHLLHGRLRSQRRGAGEREPGAAMAALQRRMPIAVATGEANEQHYELPAEFFERMLGPHLKYSSGHWSSPGQRLEQAEAEMLQLTCERAGLEDGMTLLDLGCGWGSLSLWVAERYPRCRVTAVSNSQRQARFVRGRAAQRALGNLTVIAGDVARVELPRRHDRIVSVEMFEHMRNHCALLSRIAGWLEDDGKVLVHLFCHRRFAYLFETDGDDDWMARHFFTGGMMPSLDLLSRFDRDLRVSRRRTIDGTHYRRTLLAWLRNLDRRRPEVVRILGEHYGASSARRWFVRWRLFLLASAELFGYAGGREWMVAHYLLAKPSAEGG